MIAYLGTKTRNKKLYVSVNYKNNLLSKFFMLIKIENRNYKLHESEFLNSFNLMIEPLNYNYIITIKVQ